MRSRASTTGATALTNSGSAMTGPDEPPPFEIALESRGQLPTVMDLYELDALSPLVEMAERLGDDAPGEAHHIRRQPP
jgi:hypothetical protein